jgi:hypothetical protein
VNKSEKKEDSVEIKWKMYTQRLRLGGKKKNEMKCKEKREATNIPSSVNKRDTESFDSQETLLES